MPVRDPSPELPPPGKLENLGTVDGVTTYRAGEAIITMTCLLPASELSPPLSTDDLLSRETRERLWQDFEADLRELNTPIL